MSSIVHGLLTFSVRSLLDVDGRPVAEVASPLYDDAAADLGACPYADARAGGRMNRAALRQLAAVWPDLLAGLSALAGPEPTVGQAWAAAVTGITLPLVGAQPVPRLTASLFKACLGLSQVCSALLLTADGVAEAPLVSLGDASAFFAALDTGRWLIGVEQVCAGSRPMIEDAFDALAGARTGPCPEELAVAMAAVGGAPPQIVGLHVAHLLSLQAAARQGDGPPVRADYPWLRAVFSVPNRPPEHALRLYAPGAAPACVRRYLAAPDRGRVALEAAFAVELRRIGARGEASV